jgi:hypothetical protein
MALLVGAGGAETALAEALAQTSTTGWREPTTAPERALDGVLKHVATDDQVLDNLLGGRDKARFHRTVDYTTTLTKPLLAAIARAETAAAQRDCGGRYIDGELCGLDFVPRPARRISVRSTSTAPRRKATGRLGSPMPGRATRRRPWRPTG